MMLSIILAVFFFTFRSAQKKEKKKTLF